MSRSTIWPHDKIRELIACAEAEGESYAELPNEELARQFRFAVYNFRRQNNAGQDLTITVVDNRVILRQTYAPQVTIPSLVEPFVES